MVVVVFFLIGLLVVKLPVVGVPLVLGYLIHRWESPGRGKDYFRLRGH